MGNQEQNKPVSFLLLEEDLRRDIFMNRLKDDEAVHLLYSLDGSVIAVHLNQRNIPALSVSVRIDQGIRSIG